MSGLKEKWRGLPQWMKIMLYVIAGVMGAALLGLFFGLLIQHLWNWLMPGIFGLKELGFWQAVGLFALARILFGGFGGGSDNHSKSADQKKKKGEEEDVKKDWQSWRHYDERWESEGQEAFREYAGHRNAKAGGPPDRAE